MSAARLYTPAVLAATLELAEFPLDTDFEHIGEARSASCGSRLTLGLAVDPAGQVVRIGVAAHACAIGQAAAAIFATGAMGLHASALIAARDAMRGWLAGIEERPEWPRIELIAPAQAYPGRHGAMMLPWEAAVRALEEAGCQTGADVRED